MEIHTRSPPEVSASERSRVLGHVGVGHVSVLQVEKRSVPMYVVISQHGANRWMEGIE